MLAALLNCAAPGRVPAPGDGPAPSGGPRSGDPAEGATWGTYQVDVTAVRLGDDPRSLVLTVALLADADGCSRNPRITYFVEEQLLVVAFLSGAVHNRPLWVVSIGSASSLSGWAVR
ncbi:hypothetical protein [Micromonospora fulviviridis]|uniref:hypothetical protein n=1 Tax=Micromonospora fulviviridis TaxID=47860 RepID=UPI0037B07572